MQFPKRRYLPTHFGVCFVLFIAVCVGVFIYAAGLLWQSSNVMVSNETDREVVFAENSNVTFSLPKGLTLIRPRNETLTRMQKKPGAGEKWTYISRDITGKLSDGLLSLSSTKHPAVSDAPPPP